MPEIRERLHNTGINSFTRGQKLTSNDINSINSKVNELVDSVNLINKYIVNLNIEESKPDKIYRLEEAISLIPESRRSLNLIIEFKVDPDNFDSFRYYGKTLDDSDWNNVSNWLVENNDIIDGGEW